MKIYNKLRYMKQLKENTQLKKINVSNNIEQNISALKKIYFATENPDIIFRQCDLSYNKKTYKCCIVFIDGLCDTDSINNFILKNIMLESNNIETSKPLQEYISEKVLTEFDVKKLTTFSDIIDKINRGNCAVLFDAVNYAYICDVKKMEHREISKPVNELSLKGPHCAFVESLKSNVSLLRKIVNNENFVIENIPVGERNKNNCAMGYISNIANPDLVNNVRNRLKNIDIDFLIDSGQLEQLIDDHPIMLTPQVISTERPDKIASHLVEGRICIIVDNSPYVLAVPCTFWDLFHSAEDYSIKFQFASFIRIIRLIAYFCSLFLPGIYIAITTFHTELLPTDLLFSIAAIKETIPFPLIIEIFIMEITIELIREAAARMPGSIGSSLGIVGAVLLGQATVDAHLVSPILILVVAITTLSSFATPSYSLAFSFRMIRFAYTFLGYIMGLFGIIFGAILHFILLCNIYTFGIPYFVSFSKYSKQPCRDGILLAPVWLNSFRPPFLQPQDLKKSPKISRKWDKRRINNA